MRSIHNTTLHMPSNAPSNHARDRTPACTWSSACTGPCSAAGPHPAGLAGACSTRLYRPSLAPSSPSRGRAARRTLAAAARLGGPGARGAEAQVAAGERGERAQLGLRRRHLRGRAAAAHEAAQGAAARLLRPAARLSARACPSCVVIPTCSGRPCCAPSSQTCAVCRVHSYALTSGPPHPNHQPQLCSPCAQHPAHLASMRAPETFRVCASAQRPLESRTRCRVRTRPPFSIGIGSNKA